MKRVFFLIATVIICMGGCHKYDHDLEINAEPITQVYVDDLNTQQPEYGESLQMKRIEFVQKLHELKKALRKPQQRIDTLIVLPARPIKGVDY